MRARATWVVGVGLWIGAWGVAVAGEPGPAPQPLPRGVLARLVPEVKRPRVLAVSDLRSDADREEHIHQAWRFSLVEDLDRDGVAEVVVAGRFDNARNPDDTAFVLIASSRDGRWTRPFFLRPRAAHVFLTTTPHPDPAQAERGMHAIVASMTVSGSCDYVLIYWDGRRYRYESGFDIVARQIEEAERQAARAP